MNVKDIEKTNLYYTEEYIAMAVIYLSYLLHTNTNMKYRLMIYIYIYVGCKCLHNGSRILCSMNESKLRAESNRKTMRNDVIEAIDSPIPRMFVLFLLSY